MAKKIASNANVDRFKRGSRKAKVREAFDKHGRDVAWTLGKKLQLKESSLRTWFGDWDRG